MRFGSRSFLLTYSRYSSSLFVFADRLCIEAPREGSRIRQIGDEKLLSLARECEINVNLYALALSDSQ